MPPSPSPLQELTPAELTDLETLTRSLRGAVQVTLDLIHRLDGAPEDSMRLRTADRLRCVLQDSLLPSRDDLASIWVEAQGGEVV